MQINPPFIPQQSVIPYSVEKEYLDAHMFQLPYEGNFPVSGHFCWHNGIHIETNKDDQDKPLPVCSIAAGTVVFSQAGKPENKNPDDPQNYNPSGKGSSWTDNGLVIIQHTLKLTNSSETPFTFYSAYMHLSTVDIKYPKPGDKYVERATSLGLAGKIYGSATPQIHLEICCDKDSLEKLIGRAYTEAIPNPPTKDGQTAWFFGKTLIYVPAGTPTMKQAPTTHVRTATQPAQSGLEVTNSENAQAQANTSENNQNAGNAVTEKLTQSIWVEIAYEQGKTILTSYDASKMPVTQIGTDPISEENGEYKLYREAEKRHGSLDDATKATSSIDGWYQLLRFGRVLGTSQLPATAQHWRQVSMPNGSVWVDLNAAGTYKFSEADFVPAFGWNFVDDDNNHQDQRCESEIIRDIVFCKASASSGTAEKSDDASKKPEEIHKEDVSFHIDLNKNSLKRTICKFATEWDQGSIEDRCKWIQEDPEMKEGSTNWTKLLAHFKAVSFSNLPSIYLKATWNWHPTEFIRLMHSLTVNKDVMTLWNNACINHDLPDDSTLTKYGMVGMYEYALRSSKAAVTSDTDSEIFTSLQALDKLSNSVGVIVGLRKEVDINFKNGRGDFTDRVLVLKRVNGYVIDLLHRGRYTSQPCGRYLDGGAHAYGPKREGKVVTGWAHYKAIGRLKANQTYEYKLDYSDDYGDNIPGTNFNILKRATDVHLERLVTPEGKIPGASESSWIYKDTAQFTDDRTVYFHRGYNTETGSGGCQTFPGSANPHEQFLDFMNQLKPYLGETIYSYSLIVM